MPPPDEKKPNPSSGDGCTNCAIAVLIVISILTALIYAGCSGLLDGHLK
jgi:hypothetical protein